MGGLFYCGNNDDHATINGPILCISKSINVVVASVAEAEYAACFRNAQSGSHLRNILEALGYSQPPTSIQCDNMCAVGLANDSVKIKRSKSIDMNFHWIRDRVKQKQFKVFWKEGKTNLADFFTKPLPRLQHQQAMKYLIREDANMENLSKTKKQARSYAYFTKRN